MRRALGIALALVAAPVVAASTSLSDTSSVDSTANAKKAVCKEQADTGTRFSKKRCMTKAQWDRMVEEQRRAAKEMIDRPAIAPPGN